VKDADVFVYQENARKAPKGPCDSTSDVSTEALFLLRMPNQLHRL
jgi:hypothetical protein